MPFKIRQRAGLSCIGIVAMLVALPLTACGIEDTPIAAQPRASVVSLTTPTVFSVIEVTPAAKQLTGQSADGSALKPIPAAIDTTTVILEPRADLIQDAWRQYLEDAHVMSADGLIDWTMCANGSAILTDPRRDAEAGKWRILNTPSSFEWYQAVLGTYSDGGADLLVVLSMTEDGLPNLIMTDWQDPPRRGRAPSQSPSPLTVSVLDSHSACQ